MKHAKKKKLVYFYDVVKYQLKHYKKRKGSIINAGAITNGLEYKTKSEPHSAYESVT